MVRQHSVLEPFLFGLIREFLVSEEDQLEELEPISDREFYSILAMLVTGLTILALTIGPFAVV